VTWAKKGGQDLKVWGREDKVKMRNILNWDKSKEGGGKHVIVKRGNRHIICRGTKRKLGESVRRKIIGRGWHGKKYVYVKRKDLTDAQQTRGQKGAERY